MNFRCKEASFQGFLSNSINTKEILKKNDEAEVTNHSKHGTQLGLPTAINGHQYITLKSIQITK